MEVCHSLEAGCYLSALWVALSLPEICAQAESGKSGKQAYAVWFDKWVDAPTHPAVQTSPNGRYVIHNPVFDGKACYKLRCRVFHDGDARIDNKNQNPAEHQYPIGVDVGEFSFMVGTSTLEEPISVIDGWELGNNSEDKRIAINLVWLCVAICDATLRCYRHSGHRDTYEKVQIPLNIMWPDQHRTKSVASWISGYGLEGYA